MKRLDAMQWSIHLVRGGHTSELHYSKARATIKTLTHSSNKSEIKPVSKAKPRRGKKRKEEKEKMDFIPGRPHRIFLSRPTSRRVLQKSTCKGSMYGGYFTG